LSKECPVEEFNKVAQEIKSAIVFAKIPDNFFQNAKNILNTFIASEHKDEDVGKMFGKFYNLVVLNKAPINLKFLATRDMSIMDDFNLPEKLIEFVEDYITGFLEATSDVPVEQNQCIAKTKTFVPAISKSLANIITAFVKKSSGDIKIAFFELMLTVTQLKDVEENCHLIGVFKKLILLKSYFEIARIIYRYTTNIKDILGYVKDASIALFKGNARGMGYNFGKVFQILFEYHTQ